MKKSNVKGAVLAAAVAGLFFSGKVMAAEEKKAEEPKKAEEAKICCEGSNACKGKGSCHGKDNACAGKNGCKGKGWVKVSSADACTKDSGKVVDCPKM